MTSPRRRPRAPRVSSYSGALVACVGFALVLAHPISAQDPPDTTVVPIPLDTLALDTLGIDSLLADTTGADTISGDTIFYNMPRGRTEVPAGFATGIWEWDRHAIMASGANTLADLLADVPGVIGLPGGDYGTPLALSAFGVGGGAYRIIRDGFEVYPVDGGVVDVQRVGLVGVSSVRLERSLGQMIIKLRSHEYDEGRAFSVIEAGTGDLDTNLFRGMYTDPWAFSGSLAFGLERLDTRGRGPGRDEGGNRTGTWLRYQLHLGERFALGLDYRNNKSQTRVVEYVPSLSRGDLMARAGVRVSETLTVGAYAGRSSYSTDAVTNVNLGGSRWQIGGSAAVDTESIWADLSYRHFESDLPSFQGDALLGARFGERGGATVRGSIGSWNGSSIVNYAARAWVHPTSWATLFGEYAAGDFASRAGRVADGALPPRVAPDGIVPGVESRAERRGTRGGLSVRGFGVTLEGAGLYAWSDTVHPLGTELDEGAPSVPGVHRNGAEARAVFPLWWNGLTLEGSLQWWDEAGPYLPKNIYRGSFEYHEIFKETGNLEVWFSVGVRGHDPMLTFVDDLIEVDGTGLQEVPFYQSWYGHIQVRVVTVRLWLGMDNVTLRRNNQAYPGRRLPFARSFFALRWDLWN